MMRLDLTLIFVVSISAGVASAPQDDCAIGERYATGHRPDMSEILVGDRLVVFTVSEAWVQTDLNGDGDRWDSVVHAFDVVRRETINLGLAVDNANLHELPAAIDGRQAVIVASEHNQGRDLNGDGDGRDGSVYFVFDADRGELHQAGGLAHRDLFTTVSLSFELSAGWLFCTADERGTGVDANGDGDLWDEYVGAFHWKSGRSLAFPASGFEMAHGRVLMSVWEDQLRPPLDANGDGDIEDVVPLSFDLQTETASLVPIAGQFIESNSSLGLIHVYESSHGDQDLNGDGDADDVVLVPYDFTTGTVLDIALDYPEQLEALGRRIFYHPRGEGSSWRLLDVDTGQVRSFGSIGGTLVGLREDHALLRVEERDHGSDLTGDGDRSDTLVVWLDLEADRLDVVWPSQVLVADWGPTLLVAADEGQAGKDLNRDGDLSDRVLMLYDRATRTTASLGAAYWQVQADEDSAIASLPENENGRDLDGDGKIGKARVLASITKERPELRLLGLAPGLFDGAGPTVALRAQDDWLLEVLQLHDLEWQALGRLRAGGKLAFEAKSVPQLSAQRGTVLISLGDGSTSGGLPLPNSGGQRLGLDADVLLGTWLTLPIALREVKLAGCRSIATAELPLPVGLPAGVEVFYAGYSFKGSVITAVSGTRSFVTE